MNAVPAKPPLVHGAPAVSPEKALRKLFLMLFLRGRSARGLQQKGVPRSVGARLGWMLLIYAAMGCVALTFIGRPVFGMSLVLHAATLTFLGLFVAASSGELLFNKEEGDILLHRPVTPQAMLWAKISVLVQVSLWMAGAFNLCCFFAGIFSSDGGWFFPFVHVLSTVMGALFCAGSVVVAYQLCLRWFGRERLDNLMTMAQIGVAMVAIFAGQIPQLLGRTGGTVNFNFHAWWIYILPPAWFAGVDDALAGSHQTVSFILALVAFAATAAVLWLAFGKLAGDYESGLQSLGEATAVKKTSGSRRRLLDKLVTRAPLRWWLREPVSRASFLLVGAYLMRDRDVKLRVYPGTAPMLIWPLIMLINDRRTHDSAMSSFSGFGVAFAGFYLGIIPMLAVDLLRYSQQWQAADLFRVAPMPGPGPLWHGARRAVLCILALPMLLVFGLMAYLLGGNGSQLVLMIPGIITLPVYAMLACVTSSTAPLAMPTEGTKAARRGINMMGAMLFSAIMAIAASFAWHSGWFNWLLVAETVVFVIAYIGMRAIVLSAGWASVE